MNDLINQIIEAANTMAPIHPLELYDSLDGMNEGKISPGLLIVV